MDTDVDKNYCRACDYISFVNDHDGYGCINEKMYKIFKLEYWENDIFVNDKTIAMCKLHGCRHVDAS